MMLRLEIPNSEPSFRGGTIEKWHQSEGLDVMLTSSDPGIFRTIMRSDGGEFIVGDKIGVVSTAESAEQFEDNWAGFPQTRLTADMSPGTEQY